MKTANETAQDEILKRRLRLIQFENSLVRDLEDAWSEVRRRIMDQVSSLSVRSQISQAEIQFIVADITAQITDFVDVHLANLNETLKEFYSIEAQETHSTLIATLTQRLARQVRVNQAQFDSTTEEQIELESQNVSETLVATLAKPIISQIRTARQEALRSSLATEQPDDSLSAGLLTAAVFGVGSLIAGTLKAASVGAVITQRIPLIRKGFDSGASTLGTVARTRVGQVANMAQQKTYRVNPHLIAGEQYVATLDDRVCIACSRWHGVTFWHDRPPEGFDGQNRSWNERSGAIPPLHPNCRCLYSPVFRQVEAIIDEPEERDVERLDGKPAEARTFDKWFGALPRSDQRQILGPTRLKLYDDGKIGIEDMVKDNRVLSLAELKKETGLKFDIARGYAA